MNERILIDRNICHGKPVIRGTRTPVAVILNALAGGDSFEIVQKEYDLTTDDIRACIAFAASEIDQTSYHPVKVSLPDGTLVRVEVVDERAARPTRPAPGLGRGSILYLAPDFDDTPEEFKEYVE